MVSCKRAVDLDRSKLIGVVTEKTLGPHPYRIEGPFSTRGGER